jgi:hypothetical protein
VKAIADRPADFAGKLVLLEGTLVNEGKNYFTDLRVVLKDKEGNRIHVRPWLPMEMPPGPPGMKGTRPTLSQYLNKQVELTGTVEKGALRALGEVHQVVVKQARILK